MPLPWAFPSEAGSIEQNKAGCFRFSSHFRGAQVSGFLSRYRIVPTNNFRSRRRGHCRQVAGTPIDEHFLHRLAAFGPQPAALIERHHASIPPHGPAPGPFRAIGGLVITEFWRRRSSMRILTALAEKSRPERDIHRKMHRTDARRYACMDQPPLREFSGAYRMDHATRPVLSPKGVQGIGEKLTHLCGAVAQ